jgi:antibiotic biosynthesis monooxygenase (ABM) superfamily enzyme
VHTTLHILGCLYQTWVGQLHLARPLLHQLPLLLRAVMVLVGVLLLVQVVVVQ